MKQMIDLGLFNNCVCKGRGNPVGICVENLFLREKGKQVKLIPHKGEEAVLLALDGCAFSDNRPKCDGLFFLSQKSRKLMIPVELKGTHLSDAFNQLAYTIKKRDEFTILKELFRGNEAKQISVKSFIISNQMIKMVEKEKLEKIYDIRVSQILQSEATKPIPDLREHI